MPSEKKAISGIQLLDEYRKNNKQPYEKMRIPFTGVPGKDVYNITAPFEDEGELVIAGRVESRDSEHSEVMFFVNHDGQWIQRENSRVFKLQDPFFTKIGEELIFGGVEIFPHPTLQGALSWRTAFYRGKNIASLEKFFEGPDGMKDLRLVELKDGSIGIFTRPQGKKGGRGKIGFTKVKTLEELSVEVINDAPLLNQFLDEEWGGANEIHLLSNGQLGVLGHIARFDDVGDRHYYSMVFVIDPENGEYSDIQIIAERADFLDGPTKRPDLLDVVFSGGLVRTSDEKAELYAGISDADAQKIIIPDPFKQFEQ
ncbi:MTP-1 family protein [Bacillus sp. 1P02SD]|uniref:MTP-1 family protein n=1 Tax=Bacillus sp. 1P02SD TaxID=3132264 RepID=UPI00399F85E7